MAAIPNAIRPSRSIPGRRRSLVLRPPGLLATVSAMLLASAPAWAQDAATAEAEIGRMTLAQVKEALDALIARRDMEARQ